MLGVYCFAAVPTSSTRLQRCISNSVCELHTWRMRRLHLTLQISGFSDIAVGTINACFNAGNAIGMVLGGILGDLLAKRFARAARPGINQASMLIVAPLNFLLYKALPGKGFPSGRPTAKGCLHVCLSGCANLDILLVDILLVHHACITMCRAVIRGCMSQGSAALQQDVLMPHLCQNRLLAAQHGRARQPELGDAALRRPALLHERRRPLGAGQQRRHVLRGARPRSPTLYTLAPRLDRKHCSPKIL